MHLLWNIGGISTTVASVACIIWLPLLTTPSPEEKKRMVFLLMVFAAASLGASLCPLIDLAIKINPSSSILLIAFEGTALAYCGYLAAAEYLSKPRSEYVIENLYRYGLYFMVVAMLGCFAEDSFTARKSLFRGGSLHWNLVILGLDMLGILFLFQLISWNEGRGLEKKKKAAAEKICGSTGGALCT